MSTFIANQQELIKVLGILQNITDRKSHLETLQNILIEKREPDNFLTMQATNLQISYIAKLNFQGDGNRPFSFLIPARAFYDVLKEFPPSCSIHFSIKENNWLHIQYEEIKFKLRTFDTEKFPLFPEIEIDQTIHLPVDELHRMIEKTLFASATDEPRANMNNMFLGQQTVGDRLKLFMVGTDGFRLSKYELSLPIATGLKIDNGLIIPKKGALELKRMLEIESGDIAVALCTKHLVFFTERQRMIIRLMDGGFVDFDRILTGFCFPDHAELEVKKLTQALKTLGVKGSKPATITLEIEEDSGYLSLSTDTGSVDIPIAANTAPIKALVNGQFLRDALKTVDKEHRLIELRYSDKDNQPLALSDSRDPEWTYVLMPIIGGENV